jgi:hypothetical protein
MDLWILVVGALAGATFGIRMGRPPRARAFRAFERAALLLGGRYIPSTYVPRLEAHIGGVDPIAKLHGHSPVDKRGVQTEVTVAAPGGPLLLLLPRGAATSFGAAMGGQDVPTGDPRFDAAFMVKAADAGLARAWLTARARLALLEAPEYSYELVQGQLVALRLSWETDATRLCAVMGACATLSRSGHELYAAWAAIAAELGASLPPGQPWPSAGLVFDFLVLGTPLRVECSRRPPERQSWHTRVLAPATGRELPASLRGELEALDAEAGLEGAGVYVGWSGIEPEPARMTRAVALLSAWAGARSNAAYR